MQANGNTNERAKAVKSAASKRLWTYKQEKKAKQAALLRCGSTFGIKELGDGTAPNKPGFIKTRIKCLEQVRVASPELPLVLGNAWDQYSEAYAHECSKTYKHSTGTKFFKKSKMVIAELGVQYHNHKEVKEKLTPQIAAYLKEHQKRFDDKHAFRDFVFGLQVWVPKSMMSLSTG